MKLVRPIQITDSNLVSSNIVVSTVPIWVVGTAYVIGDIIRVDATHRTYEATADNTGVYPPDNIAPTTIVWLELGATNKWSMFDNVVGSHSINTGSIAVEVDPGRVNTVGLLGIVANTAKIEMVADAVTIYETEMNLVLGNVTNWYEYFYEPIVRKTDVAFTDLPAYGEATITITLTGEPAEEVECGLCIIGSYRQLGETQWGLNTEIIDYSQKKVNQFGGFEIVKRAFSKRMEADIFMKNIQADETQRLLSQFRATAVLWIGSGEFQSSIIYGYYRDFSVILQGPGGSSCSLTVEGLI